MRFYFINFFAFRNLDITPTEEYLNQTQTIQNFFTGRHKRYPVVQALSWQEESYTPQTRYLSNTIALQQSIDKGMFTVIYLFFLSVFLYLNIHLSISLFLIRCMCILWQYIPQSKYLSNTIALQQAIDIGGMFIYLFFLSIFLYLAVYFTFLYSLCCDMTIPQNWM